MADIDDVASVKVRPLRRANFRPITLTCSNVTYTIRKKTILQGVDLIAEPGSIVAVVGPSGAGKTTLLNCMSFRIKGGTRAGVVALNGRPTSAREIKDVCNYVMTDGRMLPYLTVHETLMIASKLKLPLVSEEERAARVENVIVELGLHNCRDTYIGGEWKKGISTGERKRVCIAIELLGEPAILIMDEPTSGLDSKLACELLAVLQRLASSGRTIILSIHQPTSQMWGMLDHLHLLADGQTVYSGPAHNAKDYFTRAGFPCPKNYNPSDFFLALVSTDINEENPLLSRCTSTDGPSDSVCSSDLEKATVMTSHGADLVTLTKTFRDSEVNRNLQKRIAAVGTSESETDSQKGVEKQCISCMNRGSTWVTETKALYKRSFINSVRNPIVCCVMLLVQALQGIILGGIFWQLTGDIALQEPYPLNSTELLQNEWSQLFINGMDGRQPLLEFLEYGVDHNGSQPLFEVFRGPTFENAYQVFKCGVQGMDLDAKGFPDFGVKRDDTSSMEKVTPSGVVGALIGAAQLLDYNYNHAAWQPQNTTFPFEYWAHLSPQIGKNFYDSFARCVGGVVLGPKRHRRLITLGDIGIRDALLDLLGPGGHDMAASTENIFNRLKSCDNEACKWIKSKSTEAKKLGDETYVAGMALANVLGALFFAVANLGFSSYDALLTFPQERSLFNRESATGLYSASSYFVAKNLADLPFQLFPSFVLVTIFYLMVGLGGTFSQYIIYVVICAGVTFAAYGFGYLVSAASPRMEIAVLAAPVTLVIWLTIAGFFLRDEQIPKWINWFSYLSFYKWGFFSLVTNQFPAGGHFGVIPNELAVIIAGISDDRLWFTMMLLFILGFSYRVLAFLALKYTNRAVGVGS